ncbi:hypothetical protein ElyMa_003017000 [Elysia marginata]|uniref:Uncharacterized protein n=1 Tax=Elysia marginata TaxID=1093978 RepID=A0AAV4IHF0_9GAST|nr:hypothetical protein ElyMa_003017000 [Elysia marginata]
MSSVPPVFLLVRNLPEESHDCSNFELCVAAAKVIGRENVFGCQRIGQLWRIHPKNAQARLNLLAQGLAIQGQHLAVESQNPYIVRGSDGKEIPSTRLTVSDIPLSVANAAIESALIKKGVNFRSKI